MSYLKIKESFKYSFETNYSTNMSLLLMFLYILCNLEVSVYLESIYIKFHFVYISSLKF